MTEGELLRGWLWKRGFAAFALAFACACGGLPPVPSQGGPIWRELTSAHFVLHTDLEAGEAHALSQELEQLLAAYLQLGWKAKGDIPLKLNVVVFAEQSEYQEFAPEDVLGYHISQAMFEPWVVLGRTGDQYALDTVKHELNHAIAYQAIQNQPRWFAEGIATYFETAFFSKDSWFVVGMPPRRHLAALRYGILHPAVIMRANDRDGFTWHFYASSWLLVHYLMSHESERFGQFQERLARGERDDSAWTSAFPDLSYDRLDQRLKDYFMRGDYPAYTLPVSPAPAVTRERLMSDADVYALRALLHDSCPGCGAEGDRKAREELALALRADPRHVRVGVMRVLDAATDAERTKTARELVAAHPQSWLAWLTLAVAEEKGGRAGSDEALAAAERVAALAPRQPYALMLLAAHAAATGRGDEAVTLSKRAVRQQPTNFLLLLMRYALMTKLGRCDELPALLVTLSNVTHTPPAEIQRIAPKCVPEPQR